MRRSRLSVEQRPGGEQLRRRLFDLGWNQTKLGEEIGASSGVISRWISGERSPSLEMACRIFDATKLPITVWRSRKHRSAA